MFSFVSQHNLQGIAKPDLPNHLLDKNIAVLLDILYGKKISDELKETITDAFQLKFRMKRIAIVTPAHTVPAHENIYDVILSTEKWLNEFAENFACGIEHLYIDLTDDALADYLLTIIMIRATCENVPMKTLIVKNTSPNTAERIRTRMATEKFIVDIPPNVVEHVKDWLDHIVDVKYLIVYGTANADGSTIKTTVTCRPKASRIEIYPGNNETFASVATLVHDMVHEFGIGPDLYFKNANEIHGRMRNLTELVLREQWEEYFTDVAKFSELNTIFIRDLEKIKLKIVVPNSGIGRMDANLTALQLDPSKLKQKDHWEGIYLLDYEDYNKARL